MAATLADRLHAQGELKPEAGAKLRVLRWKRCVQGDEDAWLANTKNSASKPANMAAEAATGSISVADAMREAERRAKRYL